MSHNFVNDFPNRNWDIWSSVIFRKTKEEWGGFSNMCAGFPIEVNGVQWFTSEALYQALRFPNDPDIQDLIRVQRSPMAAKMKSKPFRLTKSRKDWDDARIEAMRWCLAAKLMANPESFGALLLSSKYTDVVEHSHRDRFWGAVSVSQNYLQGQNVLGVLLTHLRHAFKNDGIASVQAIKPPTGSKILGISEFHVAKSESEEQPKLF